MNSLFSATPREEAIASVSPPPSRTKRVAARVPTFSESTTYAHPQQSPKKTPALYDARLFPSLFLLITVLYHNTIDNTLVRVERAVILYICVEQIWRRKSGLERKAGWLKGEMPDG
jgi:hypothetical protein